MSLAEPGAAVNPELIPIGNIQQTVREVAGSLNNVQSGSTAGDGVPGAQGRYESGVKSRSGYAQEEDSTSIVDDPFDAMSHEEIWAKVGDIDPESIDGTSTAWRSLGFGAATDAADFAADLNAKVSAHWQGSAATAAGDGVLRYANSSLWLMFASDALANKVQTTHDGVSQAKANVPPPGSDTFWDSTVDVLSSPIRVFGSMKSREYEREEAQEQARTVMKTYYSPAIRDAAAQIPVLPQALNPLTGSEGFVSPATQSNPGSYGPWYQPSSGSAGGGSGGASGPGPTGGQPQSTLLESTLPPGSTPQDTATQASTWAPSDGAPPGQGRSGQGASGQGASGQGASGSGGPATSGASAGGSPTAGSTGAGAPGAGTPGGGSLFGGPAGNRSRGSTGAPGGSRFGGGSGSPGSNIPGSGIPGGASPGSSIPGGSGYGAGAGRPGTPGTGGMGGMAPPGGRGGGGAGGGDDVHKTPGYLIDAINGDELIGTLPLVAPPVLGE
ncbi:hypothetical protein QMK17_09800 [Rhodococcus sp. G-MC3]|uniref:hypothetical protein n=1 Tax=Rhodococcus sp. G-MC3 TaxID=3046209 RepID=UPI0024BAD543|nr:hypothetical protein [Rhodococcus sp. G-MC3]MDJ0393622.1 hypothetical protein [Rhodococcus sp. G-MC3]